MSDQVLLDDFINMANQCVYTFEYQEPILNVSLKKDCDFELDLQTTRGLPGESFFCNFLDSKF